MRHPLVAVAICSIGLACGAPTTPTGDDPTTPPDWDEIRANDAASVPPGGSHTSDIFMTEWLDGG